MHRTFPHEVKGKGTPRLISPLSVLKSLSRRLSLKQDYAQVA